MDPFNIQIEKIEGVTLVVSTILFPGYLLYELFFPTHDIATKLLASVFLGSMIFTMVNFCDSFTNYFKKIKTQNKAITYYFLFLVTLLLLGLNIQQKITISTPDLILTLALGVVSILVMAIVFKYVFRKTKSQRKKK
jgi:O-antigen/teichoic acid export membrane protein